MCVFSLTLTRSRVCKWMRVCVCAPTSSSRNEYFLVCSGFLKSLAIVERVNTYSFLLARIYLEEELPTHFAHFSSFLLIVFNFFPALVFFFKAKRP